MTRCITRKVDAQLQDLRTFREQKIWSKKLFKKEISLKKPKEKWVHCLTSYLFSVHIVVNDCGPQSTKRTNIFLENISYMREFMFLFSHPSNDDNQPYFMCMRVWCVSRSQNKIFDSTNQMEETNTLKIKESNKQNK